MLLSAPFLGLMRASVALSLDLYGLLTKGDPVSWAGLVQRLEVSLKTVDGILDNWPRVFLPRNGN